MSAAALADCDTLTLAAHKLPLAAAAAAAAAASARVRYGSFATVWTVLAVDVSCAVRRALQLPVGATWLARSLAHCESNGGAVVAQQEINLHALSLSLMLSQCVSH